jgi:hypothetical protein
VKAKRDRHPLTGRTTLRIMYLREKVVVGSENHDYKWKAYPKPKLRQGFDPAHQLRLVWFTERAAPSAWFSEPPND